MSDSAYTFLPNKRVTAANGITALQLSQVDLLEFSIGSFVAQQVALTRPAIVRRLVLASAAPQGAAGMHGCDTEVAGITVPTQHRILPRTLDGQSVPEPLLVSIDLSDIAFG